MRASILAASLLLALGCGTLDPSGAEEPLLVVGGQLFEGDLPGLPSDAPGGDDLPAVFSFAWDSPVILHGQGEKSVHGRVSKEATAVAIRFLDLGNGYWLVPTGAEDPQYPGQRTFSLRISFPNQLPAGNHRIAVVAVSSSGKGGKQAERSVCAAGPIPDNLHACNPEVPPPAMVVSLSWNADADVDLQIVTSDGRVVSPEHPLLDPIDAGARPSPDAARIDRDSLEGCIPDGLRRENFVIQERLGAGTALSVHANLKDSCGQSSVAFRLQIFERRGEGDGLRFIETYSTGGLLWESEAGLATGLKVARIEF